MLRLKKVLLVAGLLVTGLIGASTVGASTAQAGGWGYGYGGHYHAHRVYTPVYRVRTYYVAPVYDYHCVPSYGFGYGY